MARREDRPRTLADELSGSVRVEVIGCDVADPAERAGLFPEIERRGLTVDILVNNAGVGTIGPVVESTPEAEVAQVRVNVEALIDLTTRAVQQMVPRGRGAILNVGSTAGFQPFPGQSGYAATNAFVRSYTDGLRGELAGTGVTVADAFPKFMWVPSREVAREGIEALAHDRGGVIPGVPNKISTKIFELLPRTLLLPLLTSQHPALRRSR